MSLTDNSRTDISSFWNDTGKTGIAAWIFSTDHKRIRQLNVECGGVEFCAGRDV